MEDQHLQPPALTKQFLISPPASPPVGWQPREEGEPLVNQDLLAAIANLSTGYYYRLLSRVYLISILHKNRRNNVTYDYLNPRFSTIHE